jgi:hypothetical protein
MNEHDIHAFGTPAGASGSSLAPPAQPRRRLGRPRLGVTLALLGALLLLGLVMLVGLALAHSSGDVAGPGFDLHIDGDDGFLGPLVGWTLGGVISGGVGLLLLAVLAVVAVGVLLLALPLALGLTVGLVGLVGGLVLLPLLLVLGLAALACSPLLLLLFGAWLLLRRRRPPVPADTRMAA